MAHPSTTDAGAAMFAPFGDLTGMLEQFKVPGVDLSAIIDSRRKDVEALVTANKAAWDAMQSLAKAQSDMLTQAMLNLQQSAATMGPRAATAPDWTQADGASKAWQKMLTDVQALAAMAQKAQADAVASLSERARQSLDEAKQTMVPT